MKTRPSEQKCPFRKEKLVPTEKSLIRSCSQMLIPVLSDLASKPMVQPFDSMQYWFPGKSAWSSIYYSPYMCSLELERLLHPASITAHTFVLWGSLLPAVLCSWSTSHVGITAMLSLEQCGFLANSLPGQDSGQRVSWGIRWKTSIAFAGQACVALKIQFPEIFNRLLTLLVFMSSICKDPQPRILPRLKNHAPGPAYPFSSFRMAFLTQAWAGRWNSGISATGGAWTVWLKSLKREWIS